VVELASMQVDHRLSQDLQEPLALGADGQEDQAAIGIRPPPLDQTPFDEFIHQARDVGARVMSRSRTSITGTLPRPPAFSLARIRRML
jgi:hypothetical protein